MGREELVDEQQQVEGDRIVNFKLSAQKAQVQTTFLVYWS